MPTSHSRRRRRVVTSCAIAAMAVGVVGVGAASADYHHGGRHRHHPRPGPTATPTTMPPMPTVTTAPSAPSADHSHTATTPPDPTTTSTTTTSTTTAAPPASAFPKPSGVVFADHEARFNVLCTDDHYAANDPIVFPGQPGKSHMHTFFGNTSTDADSTIASLSAATSSCGRGMGTSDRSAYWVPSLVKDNPDGTTSVVKTDQINFVYYTRPGDGKGPGVLPFPKGLRMIAGSAMATSDQSLSVVEWTCGGGGLPSAHMYKCPGTASASLHASLAFPSCWDGVHLDSADHKSHMAYAAKDGTCPADHPVSLPEVAYEIDFPGIAGGPGYHLASGGTYSWHGDFMADWDNQVQNALVASCLNNPHECADINRDGNTLFRPDYDPEPYSFSLKGFSTTSPWDGVALEGPVTSSPMPMPMPSH